MKRSYSHPRSRPRSHPGARADSPISRVELTDPDRARALSLAAAIDEVEEDSYSGRTFMEWLVPELRELFGSDASASTSYRVLGESGQLAVESSELAGTYETSQVRTELDAWVRAGPGRYALFDPMHPEARQRNVPVNLGLYEQALARRARAMQTMGVSKESFDVARTHLAKAGDRLKREVIDRYQLRVLVCDGPLLLAWVGLLQDEPFSAEQEEMLAVLVAPMRRRLRLERQLDTARVASAALATALEAIPAAALVVDDRAHVLHANAAAIAALDADRAGMRETLLRCLAGGDSAFEIHRIHLRATRPLHLAISRATRTLDHLVLPAASRWSLTPRQRDVLGHLARGQANKTIAAELGCAEVTVEFHVTRILEKAGVDSRAALIASLVALVDPR